jgi:hypothetical protein
MEPISPFLEYFSFNEVSNASIGEDYRALTKMGNISLQKIGINSAPFQNIVHLLLFEANLNGFWITGHHGINKVSQA